MPAGRPMLYNTPEKLQKKIEEYFKMCDETFIDRGMSGKIHLPYTVIGLCDYIGMDRKTLIEYAKRSEYCNTIKGAKTKIEAHLETSGLMGLYPAAALIFNLKNNFGQSEKQETEISGKDGGSLEIKIIGT